MTEFHYIWGQMDSKWQRALEYQGVSKAKRKTPKGPVYAVELDTDDYLTLRGGILSANFGNCSIVEPRRQGYTQDFRFIIDQALRRQGLQKTHIIEWQHEGVGDRLDGSLILDTGRIKQPQRTTREQERDTSIAHQPKQRAYRECGKCRNPDAKLKCACLATHYCDTQCQREDMPEHRQECTYMILKDINLIQGQLQQHKATHGKFTIEATKQELRLTETHVKLADLLRTSRLETNQEESEYHFLQALQKVTKLESQTFLKKRPFLLYNLRTDQVAAHLGLGSLYRDQFSKQKAIKQLTKAYDLTQELITIEDSPGQQERLGVILTTHGEILTLDASLEETYSALDKQQRAVAIFCQQEQTTIGPSRELTLRKLMEALISMADTQEKLEFYTESQEAMRESQDIGERAQFENNTSPLHLHHQIVARTKETMDARGELDDHTSTLHVGSKIRVHGLIK